MTHLKHPPDTRANLLGRMLRIQEDAHRNACGGIQVVVRESSSKPEPPPVARTPPDYAKRLSVALKAFAGPLQNLQRRFERCPKMTRTPAKPKPVKPPKAKVMSSIIENTSSGPLSREAALTIGLTTPDQPKKPSLLDFLQSTLDK